MPANDGDLYFTVESWYLDMVPESCTTGTYTYTDSNGNQQTDPMTKPIVYYALYNAADTNTPLGQKYYVEQYSKPIKIAAADYTANTSFLLMVKYYWMNSPAKDYTVKVYSKQNLSVLDSNGNTNMKHMDGQTPSGFTDSTYTGMSNTGPFSNGPQDSDGDGNDGNSSGGDDNNNGGNPPTTEGATEEKIEVKSLDDVFKKASGIK